MLLVTLSTEKGTKLVKMISIAKKIKNYDIKILLYIVFNNITVWKVKFKKRSSQHIIDRLDDKCINGGLGDVV